ncbi:glutathione S-transferase family protein [Coralloluteibacterium stylophorae]|uniref:Glutathione S-transferase family protein n=1 Tax=Coralloluteibacterium stylophorae TaxID=1776034 RepID=A0A8J8AX22_9GAMM|nr:glutathione S-transferase family protein [Coralloluteibacterium stylophorae]MBS7455733.1 glutathione S-transferase family protein [Coralloluteibacterium stylophorae]
MSLVLYGHPFSSYCQKVEIALYENALPFELRMLGPEHPRHTEEWSEAWPLKKMPVLVDAGRAVVESSIIIEHLHLHHRGPVSLLPADPAGALEVRFMDRFFDQHVMTPMQVPVFEALRPDGRVDAAREAAQALEIAYAWLERRLAGRTWAAGDAFGMADCAAAPSLFYADWIHRIGAHFPTLRAYRTRLIARPSFARAVEEARPYRSLFPLGAPDRD